MFYFFDSSALAKQYHSEPGSQVVVEVFSGRENYIFTSRLALVELTSVAGIKVRTGAMTPEKADDFLVSVSAAIYSREFVSQRIVDLDYVRAQQLLIRYAREHRLRTLDALHLASAIRRRESSGVDGFVTADRTLAAVAALEGFEVLIPA